MNFARQEGKIERRSTRSNHLQTTDLHFRIRTSGPASGFQLLRTVNNDRSLHSILYHQGTLGCFRRQLCCRYRRFPPSLRRWVISGCLTHLGVHEHALTFVTLSRTVFDFGKNRPSRLVISAPCRQKLPKKNFSSRDGDVGWEPST